MKQEIFDLMTKNINKKKKSKIQDDRIWSHKCSVFPVDITRVMESQDSAFKYAYSLLFSDNKAIKMNIPMYKRRKIYKKKQSNFLKCISNDAEKILTKAYTKIDNIKNEKKELQKLNTISLQKTSKAYFQTNRPKTPNYNNLGNRIESASTNYQTQTIGLNNCKKYKRNLSLNKNNLVIEKGEKNNLFINENTKENTSPNSNSFSKRRNLISAFNKSKKSNIFNKNSIPIKTSSNFSINLTNNLLEDKGVEKYRNLINVDIPKLYSTNKKKHLNLARLNDVYRLQMNKLLRKYNADNHLKELNKIQRDNITVRQNMEDVKFKINQKINDRCKGQYYKKEYLKFKEENEKEKSKKLLTKKPFPIQIPFNILFQDTSKKIKVFPHGYKIRAYYDYCMSCDKIQKSKNNDLLEFGADILFGHLHTKDYEYLYNSLDELFNTLEIEPIVKYIDKFKNEKAYMDKTLLNERIKNYFPALTETEKRIQKMEQHQLIKRKKAHEEKNVLEKIRETKKKLEQREY